MADTDNKENKTPEVVDGGGGKKKLIIIVAAVCLLLITAVAVYFIFFNDGDEVSDEVVEQQVVTEKINIITENVYVAMPLPFVFNIQDGQRTRLVQIKVQLMVGNREYSELAQKHIPLLEGTIVRVFSSTSAEQLRSPEGKELLKRDLLIALNESTSKVEQKALINAVLFTGFVLQ